MATVVRLSDGFETGFEDWEGIGELTVPVGWAPAWVQGTRPGINHRPEYDRESVRMVSGQSSAKVFTTHASHDAVLYRRVGVQAGIEVCVRAWGATYKIGAGHAVRVGFHPRGVDGMGFRDEEMVWSEWWSQYDRDWVAEQFRELEARGIAQQNEIVVYLHSRSQYAGATVAAYFDDVEVLQEEGEPEPGDGEAWEELARILERIASILENRL